MVKTKDLDTFELYWNDPDPIEGNDYMIESLKNLGGGVYLITYNGGASEAEVPADEIFHA